jgi:hypothetical protein
MTTTKNSTPYDKAVAAAKAKTRPKQAAKKATTKGKPVARLSSV